MNENDKKTPKAWCFDFRTGWTEIDDVVGIDPNDSLEDALIATGYGKYSCLMIGSEFGTELQVWCKERKATGSEYYVNFSLDGSGCESVYCTNLPSLLSLLREFAPIYQAKVASDQERDRLDDRERARKRGRAA